MPVKLFARQYGAYVDVACTLAEAPHEGAGVELGEGAHRAPLLHLLETLQVAVPLRVRHDRPPPLHLQLVERRDAVRRDEHPRELDEEEAERDHDVSDVRSVLSNAAQDLMRELSRFPEVVEAAGASLEPHLVAQYLRELANAFHGWYHASPVLVEDGALVSAAFQAEHRVVPFKLEGEGKSERLHVAVEDPGDLSLIDRLRYQFHKPLRVYVAASDDSALRFEKLQTELGEGPCLAAYQSGEAVAISRASCARPRSSSRSVGSARRGC